MPETFNIDGVEIFAAGTWNGDSYTTEDLDQIVSAFKETKDKLKPYLKLGHSDKQALLAEDELPAAGWISNIKRVGEKLLADFIGIPKKIYELIKNGGYKRISSELFINAKVAGKAYDKVLKAVALLGGATPAVHNLNDLLALYEMSGGFGDYRIGKWDANLFDGTLKVFEIDTEIIKVEEFIIEKRGNQWCLISKSTGQTLGCHPTREEAVKQEQAVKANQSMPNPKDMPMMPGKDMPMKPEKDMPKMEVDGNIVKLSVDEMRKFCPGCAENMAAKNIRELKIDLNKPLKYQLSPAALEGLCSKFGDPEGFRTRCMDSSISGAVGDVGAFCNWLKEQCHGSVKSSQKGVMKKMTDEEIKELQNQNEKLKKDNEEWSKKFSEVSKQKRNMEIEAKIKKLVAEEKIVPAQEKYLFTILSEFGQTEKKFKIGEKEYNSVEEVVLELISNGTSEKLQTSPSSKTGKRYELTDDEQLDSEGKIISGNEDDRKIKEYMQKNKVSYKEAMFALSAQDQLKI